VVPTGNQTRCTFAPVVEVKALRAQAGGFIGGQADENLVGFDRIEQTALRRPGNNRRRRIGRAGIGQPQIIGEGFRPMRIDG